MPSHWTRWAVVTGGAVLTALALWNTLPDRVHSVLAVREWLNPWGQWGLFAFGVLMVLFGILPIPYRLRVKIVPGDTTSPQARIEVINTGDSRAFFARSETLQVDNAAQFRKGSYQLPWIEVDSREITIPQGGSAHLLLATTDTSQRSKDDLVDMLLWQTTATGREQWDRLRWDVRADGGRKPAPARALIRVTIGASEAGKTYRFRPLTRLFALEGSLYGGCSVRAATAEEIRHVINQ